MSKEESVITYVRFPKSLLDKVDRVARVNNQSRSAAIKTLVSIAVPAELAIEEAIAETAVA
jgi:metal-responsive CopG/Arc/MetJ family transcriptional regulator